MTTEPIYTPEQLQTLWEQYVEVYADEQKSFDSTVRAFSGAGVAVTVSIATALKVFPTAAKLAVGLFLISLAANLVSFGSSQRDVKTRLDCIRDKKLGGLEGNRWTKTTSWLNILAGIAFIAGGAVLAVFVGWSTD